MAAHEAVAYQAISGPGPRLGECALCWRRALVARVVIGSYVAVPARLCAHCLDGVLARGVRVIFRDRVS